MDLPKAYDYLPHHRLLLKLEADSVSRDCVKPRLGYLINRIQKRKVGFASSDWRNIVKSIPQGLILGSLLFNIFITDLFFSSWQKECQSLLEFLKLLLKQSGNLPCTCSARRI